MSYASLRDFMDRLEREGRLVRVSEPVSPTLEMTEIQTRLLAEGGPAVLFETVVDADGDAYQAPVLVNLFGTVERVAWGMNREPDDAEIHYLAHTVEECRYYFDAIPSPRLGWSFTVNHAHLVAEGIDGFIDAFGLGRCGAQGLRRAGPAGLRRRPGGRCVARCRGTSRHARWP